MKKIFLILFAFALLLGAVSCTDLLDEALRGRGAIPGRDAANSEFPEGARLTLGFNVPMPVATKAMTEQPAINSIHVFVFVDNGVSDNGVLFEVQKAVLGGSVNKNAIMDYTQTYGENGENGHIRNFDADIVLARWEVKLLMSRTKRRLHFVANLPDDFVIPETGSAEFTVMRSIQTSGAEVAYWQMVELENGVLAYTYDGTGKFSYVGSDGTKVEQDVTTAGIEGWQSYDSSTGTYHYKIGDDVIDVAKGDYIATTGHKILDGKGFYASEALSDAVSMIPLIRNFARIKVIASAGTGHNFRLDSAVLINVPGSGYVAPFDDHSNHFVDAYRKAGSTALSHDVIFNAGYPASVPPDTIVTKCPTAAVKASTVNNRDTVLLYMYERGLPTQDPTSLLVKGSLDNGEKRWFKIEIAGEDGSYFPIYRDFTYDVEIKSITGSSGYDTMKEAYDNPAIGDISSSKETETLTKIDDGNGLVLYVQYIDYTSPLSAAGEAGFLYKFYDASQNYSDLVKLKVVPVEGRDAAIDTTTSGSGSSVLTGSPYAGDGPDGSTGWYQAMVPLWGPGGETKISTLHVEGTKPGGKTLYRNVTFRVMRKQDFILSATPLASENAGEPTTLSVTLPPYLGYSVFPLTLMIEAEANNLNPGDSENLSVESGLSLFETGKNSFYFLKTISYTEYQTSRTYSIVFKTTVNGEDTALSTNATTIAVKDKNGYFNTGTTSLAILPVGISPIEQTVKGSAGSAKFNIVSNLDNISNFSWSITNVTTGASFTAMSGNTPQELTMSFDPITDPNAEGKEYTATFSYSYSLDGVTHSESVQLKVSQSALVYISRTEQVSKSFTLSDLQSSTTASITDDNNDNTSVSLTRGNGLEYYHSDNTGDWLRSNSDNGLTLIFNPSSDVTIKQVILDWSNANYRPGSISISGGADGTIQIDNNSTSGSWEGSSGSTLTATMTRRGNNNFRFQTITVKYEYKKEYYE